MVNASIPLSFSVTNPNNLPLRCSPSTGSCRTLLRFAAFDCTVWSWHFKSSSERESQVDWEYSFHLRGAHLHGAVQQ
jgi:hypothetical protein